MVSAQGAFNHLQEMRSLYSFMLLWPGTTQVSFAAEWNEKPNAKDNETTLKSSESLLLVLNILSLVLNIPKRFFSQKTWLSSHIQKLNARKDLLHLGSPGDSKPVPNLQDYNFHSKIAYFKIFWKIFHIYKLIFFL